MDAYERKCAVCSQSIRLGDVLIGIDACHVKPIQHFGADEITNGIALCKIHHWALDRGAISMNENLQLLLSPKLNGYKLSDHFTDYDGKDLFLPRQSSQRLELTNISYHNEYIFVK